VITTEGFELIFDKAAGQIASLAFQGTQVLQSGPVLNAWRAATDNDGFKLWPDRRGKLLTRWLKAGLDRLQRTTEHVTVSQPQPQVVVIRAQTAAQAEGCAGGFTHAHTYTIYGSGDVVIENRICASPTLPPLPRMGVTMTLPAGFEQFTWYGRGPHENYVDRKAGAAVGVYRSTVDEQYVPYIMPQENGNKTDVRWLVLENDAGAGLLASGMQCMEVSASHYTADDLYKAFHTNELQRRDETILNLDYKQCGLGGGSCGPMTRPEYLLQPGSYTLTFRLRPFSQGDCPPALARQAFPAS
jgi:beta-galactosidase